MLASPICSADIMDRIHMLTTDMHYLDVVDGQFPINHYYDDNTLPDHDKAVELMRNIALSW